MSHVIRLIIFLLLLPLYAFAGGDLTAQDPIEVRVELGNSQDKLAFFPNTIAFETGKLYRLILHNPSPQKHYFSSALFSRSVFTRKVQINDAQGKATAEVKGTIDEIEVYPNGTTEWWLVPIKTGTFTDLRCTISGHTEGGMVGTITIE